LHRDDADRYRRGGIETVYRPKPQNVHLVPMPLTVSTKA
jgi:hypothetical protein